MERAEREEGWQEYCRERGLYVALSPEFVGSVGRALACAGFQPGSSSDVLEIASGTGELAQALNDTGMPVIATDPAPAGPGVAALSAEEALQHYSPAVVLTCFPPLDAGIEAAVFRCAAVRRFLYIGPLVYGQVNPSWRFDSGAWEETPLPEVNRFLISRLDYLTDFTRDTWKQRAEAVLFTRR